jgi:hypothetical protein
MIAEDSKARRSKKPQAPSDNTEIINDTENAETGRYRETSSSNGALTTHRRMVPSAYSTYFDSVLMDTLFPENIIR